MDDVKPDIRALFCDALDRKTPDELAEFLDAACGGDADLRAQVEELLASHRDAGRFLGGSSTHGEVTLDHRSLGLPGTQIGPYKLLEQIGEGGMGVVYVASQNEPLRRKVALKIIKPGMDTREVVARFEAERQALALMDHPNIAKVYDAGATDAGRPYFAMELVQGTPITEYCDQHQLSTRERLELFVTLCHGVQHAHQRGLIHRDLKPSNLLVEVHDVRPVPKIIDFGIAKAVGQRLSEQSLHTAFDQMVGTPLYMSPEQAGQSCTDVDTRSDIYSLGVLLYELLTGHTPFEKGTLRTASADEMRRIIREVDPPRPSVRVSTLQAADLATICDRRHMEPSKLSQQLRGELDWIVMKALDKDRDRRYVTANELAADVERYFHDEPVQAYPPSAAYRISRFARRNKVVLTAAALVTLALVIGFGVAIWQSWRATQARDLAERQKTRAEKNLQRAMDAVDEMLTQVGDKELANVPQLEPIRRTLLQKSLAFYQELGDENDSDPKARYETGLAHRRSGDILALMGKHGDAEKEFQQAIAVLALLVAEFPDDPAYVNELTKTHNVLGTAFAVSGRVQGAEKEMTSAIKAQKALVAKHPNEPEYQNTLGLITGSLAALLLNARRNAELEILLRGALQRQEQLVLHHPQSGEYRETLGRLKECMARCEEAASHYPEAEESVRAAIGLFQQLVSESPEQRSYRYLLGVSQNYLAVLLGDVGRLQEAVTVLRESLENSRQRVRDFPYIPDYRAGLGDAYLNLAAQLLGMGSYEEAEKTVGEAMLVYKQLAGEFPQVPSFRVGLAGAYNNLGGTLVCLGRLAEAEEAQRAALQIRQQLAKGYPTAPDYRMELGGALENMATNLVKQRSGRNHEAEQFCRQAQSVYQQLAADFPSVADYRWRLGQSLERLGMVLSRLQRNEEAERSYRQAMEILEPIAQAPNALPDRRRRLNMLRERLGLLIYERGRHPEAEEMLRDAVKGHGQLAAELPAVPEYRGGLIVSQIELGCLVSDMHREAEGEEILRAALDIAKELAADFAQVPEYRRLLGDCYYNLGHVLGEHKRQDNRAEAAYRQAVEVFEKLVVEHPSPAEYSAEYRLARHALAHLLKDSGRLEEARDCWNKEAGVLEALIKEYPDNQNYYFLCFFADVRKELASLDKAIAQKAVEHSPDNATAHHRLAGLYARDAQYAEALVAFDQAIRFEPNKADFYADRARIHVELAHLDQALEDSDKSIALESDLAMAYSVRGIALSRQGLSEKAAADWNTALSLSGNDGSVYVDRARTLAVAGDFKAAISDFTKAIHIRPLDPFPVAERGFAYAALGDEENAKADWQQARQLDPNLAQYHSVRAAAAVDRRTIVAEYTKSIQLDHNQPGAFYNRGRAHFSLQQFEQALADFNKGIELEPSDTLAMSWRAKVHQRLGKLDVALADSEKSIQREPNNRSHYFHRSILFREKGDYELALADLQRVIDLGPEQDQQWLRITTALEMRHDTILKNLKEYDHRMGAYELALADLQRVNDFGPEQDKQWCHITTALEMRGDIYLVNLKEYDKAIEEYAKVKALLPLNAGMAVNYAGALLLSGKMEEYRRACVETSERFDLSNNAGQLIPTALCCVLGPNGVSDPMKPVNLAERAVASRRDMWVLHVLGMTYLRAGQLDLAARNFHESQQADPGWCANFKNSLGLSMVHYQRGETETAWRWFAEATDWIDQHPEEYTLVARDWLEAELLRREVEALLKPAPAPPSPNPAAKEKEPPK